MIIFPLKSPIQARLLKKKGEAMCVLIDQYENSFRILMVENEGFLNEKRLGFSAFFRPFWPFFYLSVHCVTMPHCLPVHSSTVRP
jgi:hypothetical protein